MVAILVRAFSTVITVVVAVLVSATLGDSAWGKIWAAVLIAAVIALIEWLLIWTPKHSATARSLLDPRARHVGVWLQLVRKVVSTFSSSEDRNRFAVYWVDYKPDGYYVTGFAFDGEGNEFARWHSTGNPDFGPGGQSMSYRWTGEVIGLPDPTDNIDRTGVTRVSLDDRTGRVDHVGMNRILLFDLESVSSPLLTELNLGSLAPEALKNPSSRSLFAKEYAKRKL